ncbi:MAG: hypothetical protein WC712_10920 [Candidatus Brocadiia bacterium]
MTRRLFATALLTAVFCCTLSVPRADEPPADSLAKYLPAETLMYVEAGDIGSTLARVGKTAVAKLMAEGDLWKMVCERLTAALPFAETPEVDFGKIATLFVGLEPQMSSAFTGQAEISLPEAPDGVPLLLAAFRVAEGKDAEANAIIKEIASRLSDGVLPECRLVVEKADYRGTTILGILDVEDPQDEAGSWFCVSGGFALVSFGKSAMCWILDKIAAPPAENLLNLAAFRENYASVASKDIRGYFSCASMMRKEEGFRAFIGNLVGRENTQCFENATFLDGMSFNELAIEDELLVSLGGKQWPFPVDTFPSDAPCLAASAALFPADTACYICANISPVRILELISRAGAKGGIDDLKQKGIDIEGGLIPLLGNEVALGIVARSGIPTGMIAVQLKDTPAALQWFKSLVMAENEALGDPMEYGGATLFPYRPQVRDFLDLPREIGTMAFAVKEGWLLYGPVLTLKNQLTSKAAGLPENADFASTIPPMLKRKPQIVAFANLRSITEQYYLLLVNGIAGAGDKGEEIAAAMPSQDRVKELAIPIAACASVASDGCRLFSSGSEAITAISQLMLVIIAGNVTDFRYRTRHHPPIEVAPMQVCKSFGSAAVAYSQTKATQDYWGSGTTDFTPHFMHISPKGGYKFQYFSNSSAPNVHDATKFVYLACPETLGPNEKALYIDESQCIYESSGLTEGQQQALLALKNDGVKWAIDDQTRLDIPGVSWVRK